MGGQEKVCFECKSIYILMQPGTSSGLVWPGDPISLANQSRNAGGTIAAGQHLVVNAGQDAGP